MPRWLVFGFGIGVGVALAVTILVLPRQPEPEEVALESAAYELYAEVVQQRKEAQPDPALEQAFVDTFGETRLGSTTRNAVYEPQPIHVRVGNAGAELNGASQVVIQAAIDHVAALGGGEVELLPGTYVLRNSVHLRDHVTLRGSGPDTVLQKAPVQASPLVDDVDWYENSFRVRDATGFQIGDGILLWSHPLSGAGMGKFDFVQGTIAGVEGNQVYLRQRLGESLAVEHDAHAGTTFTMLSVVDAKDVRLESLTLEGDREHNNFFDGNLGGAVYTKGAESLVLRAVNVRNFNGDGFSIQASVDVRIENCSSSGNRMFGYHLGGGSRRVDIVNSSALKNGEGLYFCWGVTESVVEGGQFSENERYGATLGHRDTNNVIKNARFERNGRAGLEFREPFDGTTFGGHRNRLEGNTFSNNNAQDGGWAVAVASGTYDVTMSGNVFQNDANGPQTIGIKTGTDVKLLKLENNRFEGVAVELDRSGWPKRRLKALVTPP